MNQNTGCEAVDVSRTCFSAWKNVPNGDGTTTPRFGRYYFLEPGCAFRQHSQLGGHWWEGHPFQTGDWSTAEVPKPAWVNGSMTFPIGWPAVHCCFGLFPEFAPTRATMIQTRQSDGAVTSANAVAVSSTGTGYAAYWLLTTFNPIVLGVNCSTSFAGVGSPFCGPPSQALEVFLDPSITDPDYQFTARRSPATLPWLPTQLCTLLSSVEIRFYGTPIP